MINVRAIYSGVKCTILIKIMVEREREKRALKEYYIAN